MYDDKWPTNPSGDVAWKEIKDESNRWDVSEFNNVAPYGKKWPNPNEKCLDGTACVFCQNSFGPEGYYRLGTCACLYHPQCLIRGMVTIRKCQVCHATFHPHLYQMFGMQDFMPTHVYYSIYDFPNVALEEHTGQPVEWSWKYNKSKLNYLENIQGTGTKTWIPCYGWPMSCIQISHQTMGQKCLYTNPLVGIGWLTGSGSTLGD
jgi:hypothetical protein